MWYYARKQKNIFSTIVAKDGTEQVTYKIREELNQDNLIVSTRDFKDVLEAFSKITKLMQQNTELRLVVFFGKYVAEVFVDPKFFVRWDNTRYEIVAHVHDILLEMYGKATIGEVFNLTPVAVYLVPVDIFEIPKRLNAMEISWESMAVGNYGEEAVSNCSNMSTSNGKKQGFLSKGEDVTGGKQSKSDERPINLDKGPINLDKGKTSFF